MAAAADVADAAGSAAEPAGNETREVEIAMQGGGPLVVREKFHAAVPMSIDQALFEMELVGHDFFLFTDAGCGGMPSVVYRRRGYQYGVIRLMEEHAAVADLPGRTEPGDNQTLAAGAGASPARQQRAVSQFSFGPVEEGETGAGEAQARPGRRRAVGE
jgi:hypothetical protein